MQITIDFTEAQIAWLKDYMDEEEPVDHAVKGIVLMVLADLDRQTQEQRDST